jgi:hypothetical protein
MARVELKVIRDCLNEEIITLCPPRRPSTISSIGSSSTLRDTLTKPQEMNPQEWMESEEDFQHFQIYKEEGVQIPFERCFSSNHYAAGLSPKCSSVFFLSPKNIVVYSLDNFPKVTKEDIRLNRVPPAKGEFKAAKATITDRFLALIIRANPSRLLLYEYDVSAKSEGDIGSEVFEMWYPTCLAMHEASNRTWVAVGCRRDNLGSIKMYSIEGFRGKLALKRHDAMFDKCVPNALANDWPKVVDFSTDGQRLVCLTNKNKVLVWFLSNNARPRQAAFEIMKPYEAVSVRASKDYYTVGTDTAVFREQCLAV